MSAPGTTPGPWSAERCGLLYPNRWNVISHFPTRVGEIQEIRTIDQVLDYCGAQEAAANAHLIAASPALYDALEIAMEYVNWLPPEGREAFKACAAALALARGETA